MKPQTRYARKLDRKRVLICLLIFFALLPVFSYIHETGHALVCIVDGNEAEISVDIFSGGMQHFAMVMLAIYLHTKFLEAYLQELLEQP